MCTAGSCSWLDLHSHMAAGYTVCRRQRRQNHTLKFSHCSCLQKGDQISQPPGGQLSYLMNWPGSWQLQS